MNYTPQLWTNTTLGPIFSEMLYSNDTVSKGLVRVLENIKYKQVVTTISGDLTVQAYAVNPVTAGAITFGDTEIAPVKKQVYHTFTMDAMRSTRFGQDMKSGAANMESNEFLQAVLAYAIPKIGRSIEKDFWVNLTAKLDLVNAGEEIVGVALTAGNIVAELQKVYSSAAIAEAMDSNEVTIYVPRKVKQLIAIANQNALYRDLIAVSGDSVSFLNIPVQFVDLAGNNMIAGRKSDLILGTDLASDFGSLEVGKVNNTGDEMFLKATFSLDAAVVVPAQKVLYKG
ncbi:hypothetical protein [Hymenobacter siberiensis]|uniref:hypothetical protein n=1 Tax=Hymenobacter siberiensis TaxID=2848396 RepID=UPI001C1DF7CB|nr:hypothetical protein [Hymenobacter siberiensis]